MSYRAVHPVLSPTALRFLSVTSIEPQTPDELEMHLAKRGTVLFLSPRGRSKVFDALTGHGYLSRSGAGVRGEPYRYALTREGEETLNRHWGRAA